MRSHIKQTLGMAIVAIALATTAQAQSRGHDDHRSDRDRHQDDRRSHDDHHDRDDHHRPIVVHRADGDVHLIPRNRATPPGLIRKPAGLPPGQFRKRYTALQGANTLSGELRRRGYVVDRIGTSGNSRVVYYRGRDGVLHRAFVNEGSNQLGFTDVPSSALQRVMQTLYGR